MVARRRVHNTLSIQLFLKPSDHTRDVSASDQNTYHAVRTHRARSVFEFAIFAVAVIVPFSVHAGVFQSFLEGSTTNSLSAEVIPSDSALDVSVLSAAVNPDPHNAHGGADVLASDGVLISTGPVGRDEMSAARNTSGEISAYVVRPGDSLSQIAEMFDVTANTILWANDLTRASVINPGDTLIILPVAGVRHVVKRGDTIATIAKKYEGNAEEIIAYNQLDSATNITVGDTLVIPGGEIKAAPVVKKTTIAKPTKSSASTNSSSAGNGTLVNPAPGTIKTQGIHGYNGVDFGGHIGTTVRAAAAGTVIVAKATGWNGGYGSYIVIKHTTGTQTLYAHLSRVDVTVGENVAQAETVGALGNSGKSTGPHLHFEVRGGKNPF